MNIQETARTLPHRRRLIVRRLRAAAAGVTATTVRTWRSRHMAEREPGQSNRCGGGRGQRLRTLRRLHVAIDDRRHLAFTQRLRSESREDATAFLNSSLAWFKQHGVIVEPT